MVICHIAVFRDIFFSFRGLESDGSRRQDDRQHAAGGSKLTVAFGAHPLTHSFKSTQLVLTHPTGVSTITPPSTLARDGSLIENVNLVSLA